MKPINVEITMGHDIGISESYYKPTEREGSCDKLRIMGTIPGYLDISFGSDI